MKRLVLGFLVVLTGVLVGGASASAGGWAVTTLDPLPSIAPGKPATIGFTIRQHGVTPVDLTGVALVVSLSGGGEERFPARLDGTTGHYVADVQVPAGDHQWRVEQGSFGPQDLGPLSVRDSIIAAPTPDPFVPVGVRWALLALTVMAAVAFVGLLAWPTIARSQPAR
jgi:hypothetical protein